MFGIELNVLVLIVISFILAVAALTLISKISKIRKETDGNKSEFLTRALVAVRDVLAVAFQEAIEFKEAEKEGYESVKKYVFDRVEEAIKTSDIFTETEKALLSRETVERILEPYLKSLWDYKLEMPNKNMSKLALAKAREE